MRLAPAGLQIRWTPIPAVGVEAFDAQHLELFCRAERLVHALRGGGCHEVDPLLHSFLDYVTSHLACEEQWMTEAEYPGLKPHRDAHWRFGDQLQELERAYRRQGPTPPVALAVRGWLTGWMTQHIASADATLGRWLTDRDLLRSWRPR